jgi:hypothetical protein
MYYPNGGGALPKAVSAIPRPWRIAIVVIALLALCYTLYLIVPTWIVSATLGDGRLSSNQWVTAVAAQRQAMLFVFGGAIAIYGVYLNFRRQRLGEDTGRADRYATALAHLASERVEIRSAGVYLLEQVMVDRWATDRERKNISDVLCTFIREGSTPLYDQFDDVRPARSDIKAAAVVLARRPRKFSYPPVDLTKADLSGIDLTDADFSNGNLFETVFVQSILRGALLSGANIQDSNWKRAHLESANLSNVYAHAADFSSASMIDVNLENANLVSALFVGTNLDNAAMEGAVAGATFEGASMRGAHGDARTDFTWGKLSRAVNLDRSRFPGATFDALDDAIDP